MQYALMEVQGQMFLVDANEMQAVESYGPEGIADSPKPDEQTAPFWLCYGVYIPQQNVSDEKSSPVVSVKFETVAPICGHAFTVTEETTPNVLPPPPRSAQKRSVFSSSDAVRN